MGVFLQDLRYAVRKLAGAPAFTLAAVSTLAIGIGATTAIFSTVNATILRPLPYSHPEELVALRTDYTDGRMTTGLVAAAEMMRINDSNISTTRAVAVNASPFEPTLLRDNAAPVHVAAYGVTEGFFDIFGLPMTLGAPFTHEQHAPITSQGQQGPPPLVVMSHRVWTEMFGSDPQIAGKTIRFAEFPTIVVGVAPRDLDYPHNADFWMNMRSQRDDVGHGHFGIVRMKRGTTIDRLRSELSGVMAGLARDFPMSDSGRVFLAQPLAASIVGDLGPTLLVVFASTALLLLLACVNVTNLLLGRGAARAREVAVRTAIGASRGRIVRQLFTESFVVTLLGAVGGLGFAYAGVRALQTLGASKLPRLESVPFDSRVIAFAGLVLVASAVMLGVAPAMRLARTDLKTLMNESGRSASGGRATARLMGVMTVVEVALALILVAGAGWLVQSFAKLRTTDPGFATTGRVLLDLRPNPQAVRGGDATIAWTRSLFDRLHALPGVTTVASTAAFPLRGTLDGSLLVQLNGETLDATRPRSARMRLVTPGFFAAMNVPLDKGRDFTADDRQNTQPVAVVNREFVRRNLNGRDPLTTSFAWGYPTVDTRRYVKIVGVVGDIRYRSIAEEPEPSFYVTQGQFPFPRQTVVVASKMADVTPLVTAVRSELLRSEPQLAIDIDSADHFVAATLSRQQLGMTLMLIFGITALVLAAVGIYGVIAYASAQRLSEIATRLALGATPTDVFWLMMRRGLGLALVGVAIGLAAAYAGGRAVSSMVYGVRASDPVVLAGATAVVALLTWIATAIPARHAAQTDPVLVLRGD
jgi:putative ABC transport system permease protein